MLAPLSIGRLKFNHVDEARKNNNSSLSPAMLQNADIQLDMRVWGLTL